MSVWRRNGRVITGSILMAAVLAAGAFVFWCVMVVYPQTAPDRYRGYELAGGP
ncbi:MAG TPA: hypothetical protein VG268_11070 [Streptosporangiaceae bacterium]|nr:hypothetical protein [Streptosporangiaceae bacterium]